jgi:hypothetical protein
MAGGRHRSCGRTTGSRTTRSTRGACTTNWPRGPGACTSNTRRGVHNAPHGKATRAGACTTRRAGTKHAPGRAQRAARERNTRRGVHKAPHGNATRAGACTKRRTGTQHAPVREALPTQNVFRRSSMRSAFHQKSPFHCSPQRPRRDGVAAAPRPRGRTSAQYASAAAPQSQYLGDAVIAPLTSWKTMPGIELRRKRQPSRHPAARGDVRPFVYKNTFRSSLRSLTFDVAR